MSDISGLNELVADLADAPHRVQRWSAEVLRKSAGNVAADARRLISGVRHAPQYPQSITFDAKWKGKGYEAEIGPDKDRPQGALGNILEYGTSKNAPLAHLGPALDREGPRFVKALEDLADL
jgi:hypothetical protein